VSHLSENIKYLRTLKGWTQKQLGKTVGASLARISNYEKGISDPSIELLNHFSEIFNVTIDELINKDLSRSNTMAAEPEPDYGLFSRLEQKLTKRIDELERKFSGRLPSPDFERRRDALRKRMLKEYPEMEEELRALGFFDDGD
jgi:transcriptional regulator with XRE-family HTH domain